MDSVRGGWRHCIALVVMKNTINTSNVTVHQRYHRKYSMPHSRPKALSEDTLTSTVQGKAQYSASISTAAKSTLVIINMAIIKDICTRTEIIRIIQFKSYVYSLKSVGLHATFPKTPVFKIPWLFDYSFINFFRITTKKTVKHPWFHESHMATIAMRWTFD